MALQRRASLLLEHERGLRLLQLLDPVVVLRLDRLRDDAVDGLDRLGRSELGPQPPKDHERITVDVVEVVGVVLDVVEGEESTGSHSDVDFDGFAKNSQERKKLKV